jgi:O-methyltransferase
MNRFGLPVVLDTPHRILFRHEGDRVPEATVIVPIWNGARFLREGHASVCAQEGVAIELIVVDDGSTDESGALACRLIADDPGPLARALVVRHERNAGPAAARNTAMALATTPAALLFDIDNILYPRCVRRCLEALEAAPVAFVYPILRLMGARGGLQGIHPFDSERLARGNYIDTLAMVRRAAWAEVGGFPELDHGLEDFAFWLTLVGHGLAGAQVPEILAAYRTHEAGRTAVMLPQLNAIHDRLERAFPWISLERQGPDADTAAAGAAAAGDVLPGIPASDSEGPARLAAGATGEVVTVEGGPVEGGPVEGGLLAPAADGPAALYVDLMIRILANTIYRDPAMTPGQPKVFDPALRAEGRDWPATAHSMAGTARLRNLADLVARTLADGIAGDYIEAGVWRGGACILMRAVLAAHGERRRRVFVADSFEGLPPPKAALYPADAGDDHHTRPELAVSQAEVEANFARYGLLDGQVVFVKGTFDRTLPALQAGPFALIRLDGDMYESTLVALEALYPRLSPGGFVIVDDFGAVPGCRQAVEDYRRRHGIAEPLQAIDWTGVWWRKSPRPAVAPEPVPAPAAAAPAPGVPADIRAEHAALAATFARRCAELGLRPDPLLFWYHTVDLGDGLVTPGSFDYRASIGAFGLPAAMTGMTALDVGSATGFFAFEMERRGARVTSVELPALADWDVFPGESRAGIIAKIRDRLRYHSLSAPDDIVRMVDGLSEADLHRVLLDGPFRFCHDRLGSQVERVYASIHDLGSALPGRRFDLVMLGDILVHVVDPLHALASAAVVCGGDLIIADDIIGEETDPPALRYVGGAVAGSDMAEWWRPNVAWYRQVLGRLGFGTVVIGAPFTGIVRPGGELLRKRVIRARRDRG